MRERGVRLLKDVEGQRGCGKIQNKKHKSIDFLPKKIQWYLLFRERIWYELSAVRAIHLISLLRKFLSSQFTLPMHNNDQISEKYRFLVPNDGFSRCSQSNDGL